MLTSPILRGQRALVTGAGRRVGRAIALALGRCGMHVAVHHHASAESADETCERIREAGGQAFSVAADLTDRSAAAELVATAVARLGGLDLLVPSAANFERVPYADVEERHWDAALDLNLTAPFLLVKHATPSLRAARGAIVFVTCSSTSTPFRNYLPYVVSKGAVYQLMRVLALELAPDVRVNAVAPGTVLPPETMTAEQVERLTNKLPLQTVGRAEDVADAVVYLASAPFVTGHELVVDGGRALAAVERY